MPINNSLKPVKLPSSLGLNEKINTEFIDHLDAIKVTLTNSPSFDDLCDYFRSPNIWKKDNTGWKLRKSLEKI